VPYRTCVIAKNPEKGTGAPKLRNAEIFLIPMSKLFLSSTLTSPSSLSRLIQTHVFDELGLWKMTSKCEIRLEKRVIITLREEPTGTFSVSLGSSETSNN
jgi:hypothetical protein